jgi:hypothetical protein
VPRKPPQLTVIPLQPAGVPPAPPADLGAAGRALWTAITAEFDVADAEGLFVLGLAAQAADRAQRCRERIDADGEAVRTQAGIKAHPLLRDELQNRALCARLIGQLGLRLEPVKPIGRPPGSKAV